MLSSGISSSAVILHEIRLVNNFFGVFSCVLVVSFVFCFKFLSEGRKSIGIAVGLVSSALNGIGVMKNLLD